MKILIKQINKEKNYKNSLRPPRREGERGGRGEEMAEETEKRFEAIMKKLSHAPSNSRTNSHGARYLS